MDLHLDRAFDCVDHDILLRRLEQSFGVTSTPLTWIRSFLHGRTQQVCYAGRLSAIMLFGVPQGVGPWAALFLLYTTELIDVIASSGLTGHSYADDTQVYISAPAASTSTITQMFVKCVERVDAWMSSNRLRMNADKTQLVWLSTRQLDKLSVTELSLLSTRVQFSMTVSDLGVLIYTVSLAWLIMSRRSVGPAFSS